MFQLVDERSETVLMAWRSSVITEELLSSGTVTLYDVLRLRNKLVEIWPLLRDGFRPHNISREHIKLYESIVGPEGPRRAMLEEELDALLLRMNELFTEKLLPCCTLRVRRAS